jgi:hypothetical protein
MQHNPYAPPKAEVADVESAGATAPARFFAVSPVKLVVMSICTLGLYQIFWFYRQWVHIKNHSEPLIIPWARALFGIFWCYSCFEFIRNEERRLDVEPTLAAGPLAIGWIVVSLTWRLPEPSFLIGFLAPLLLIPVQQHINRINTLEAPDHDKNARFTGWNWLGVTLGGIFLLLIIVGLAQRTPRG